MTQTFVSDSTDKIQLKEDPIFDTLETMFLRERGYIV